MEGKGQYRQLRNSNYMTMTPVEEKDPKYNRHRKKVIITLKDYRCQSRTILKVCSANHADDLIAILVESKKHFQNVDK